MSSDEGSIVEALEPVEGDFETEQVENSENVEVEAEEANDDQNQDGGNKTLVKPKRIVKNPQPKLNEQTLRGPKGLTALQGYFEKVKFKGKGYEDQDLNIVMKTYEYWCHRMFPKYPFDASIARLEVLGGKKATQTYLKRIRMDLIFDDEEKPVEENENEDIPTEGFVDPVETSESQFDQLLSSSSNIVQQNQITEEQLERIRQNKERAEKLRQERMRKIREKAAGNLEESNYLLKASGSKDNPINSSPAGQSSRIEHSNINSLYEGSMSRNDNETDRFHIEPSISQLVDNEMDIDTVLDEINDGNDKISKNCNRGSLNTNDVQQNIATNIIGDDDDDELVNGTLKHTNEHETMNDNVVPKNIPSKFKHIIDDDEEDELVEGTEKKNNEDSDDEDNIENILNDINDYSNDDDDTIAVMCRKKSNPLLDDENDTITSSKPLLEHNIAKNQKEDGNQIVTSIDEDSPESMEIET